MVHQYFIALSCGYQKMASVRRPTSKNCRGKSRGGSGGYNSESHPRYQFTRNN
jgi:hypothetical protein